MTPNSTEERVALKPCPFCGSEASAAGHTRYSRPLDDTTWADGSPIIEAFYVNCMRCGIANGRPSLVGGYQTKAEAIERWNTRTDNDVSGLVEALERATLMIDGDNRADARPSDYRFGLVEDFKRLLAKHRQPNGGAA